MESFTDLKAFRKRAYSLLGNGKDSLCDLMDAVLTSRGVPSFAELSLSPVFRREWPSLYKVLERSELPRQSLMELYVEHLPETERVILAGDHTAWPRLWANTLQERTHEHQPSPSPGGTPVTVGPGYSSLVCVPEMAGSWVLPLLHERITSFESPLTKAAAQLKQVCEALDHRPLSLWDSEYGCARFIQLTAEITCDKLMRLRSNRVLYGPPPPDSGYGRPRKHGDKFKLNDPNTWWPPQHECQVQDDTLGHLKLRGWTQMHFYKTADVPMQLILVERLDATGQPTHRPLSLIATGEDIPALETLWRLYLRRFCVDHWYRFIKQRLHWCLPQLSTAEQAASWSDLMPLMSWQLWLARPEVQDHPLPWQKPLKNQTPGRVANAFAAILVAVGTLATEPKPRGKSPGWPKGQKRTPKQRFPTVKKSYSKPKSQAKSTA